MSITASSSRDPHHGRSKDDRNGLKSNSTKTELPLVSLNDKLINTFYPDKAFANPVVTTGHSVTSICFDYRGDRLLTSGSDEKIQLFSCSSGRLINTHYSKKYGVDLVRFTHDVNTMIHASTKVDHAIRYHSLSENKYISYFRGHSNRVSSLDISPTSTNAFMSAAVHESVRLWDLRSSAVQACMVIQGHPITRYDPTGSVFALAFNESNLILLYDARKWSEKPFNTLEVPFLHHQIGEGEAYIPVITSLHFNPTGSMLLVGTSGQTHYVFDAETGKLIHRLVGRNPLKSFQMNDNTETDSSLLESPMVKEAGISGNECGWTPDGKYIYSASGNKDIMFWSVDVINQERPQSGMSDLKSHLKLDTYPGQFVRAAVFNPRNALMATAGDQVALWLPETKSNE